MRGHLLRKVQILVWVYAPGQHSSGFDLTKGASVYGKLPSCSKDDSRQAKAPKRISTPGFLFISETPL